MTLYPDTGGASGIAAPATRHRLIAELYKTRCGPVWAAKDDQGTLVALRPIGINALVNDRKADAIAAAARAGLGDDHERVAPIVDVERGVGELRVLSRYHDGLPLAQLLRLLAARQKPLPPAVGMAIALDLLDGLAYLHDAGYEPGGLTPDNVLVGVDGRCRLIEARIAVAVSQVEVWAHHRDAVAYRAPEQLSSRDWDGVRAEVFSVAAIVWELLAGERLFGGYGYQSVAKLVASRPIPRLDSVGRGVGAPVSRATADTLQWALDRNPTARPANVAELVRVLRVNEDAVADPSEVAELVGFVLGRSRQTEAAPVAEQASHRQRITLSSPPVAEEAPRASIPEPFRPSTQRRAGRCHLFVELARGGMAAVHLGRWLGVGGFARTVAVKALHEQYAKDPEFVRMFLDEARVVARIRHPTVVSTLDLVEEAGKLFIVMDYVEGVTLAHLSRQVRRRQARVPKGVTLRIITGVLHGLHAAHQARDEQGESLCVIHRDVSPENVLVGTDGYARLIDFGIASALGRYAQTRDGQVKGKLSYLAPEQITGAPVTLRTDVYAASVVLWQTLTGRKLFQVSGLAEMAYELVNGTIPRPSRFVPDIDPSLERIVMKGLSRDPAERWDSAEAMAEALEALGPMTSHRATGEWVRTVAERRIAHSAAMVSSVEQATVEQGTEALARPLSIRPAPPEALDDVQGEGTAQTWGLSAEDYESTTNVTLHRGAAFLRMRREHWTWVLGVATAAAVAALVALTVVGVRDAALAEPTLRPIMTPAVLASAVGPGLAGEAATDEPTPAAQPSSAPASRPAEEDEDEPSAPSVDGPAATDGTAATGPSSSSRPRRALRPLRLRPKQGLFIPNDI
ncbi:MAG: protein kinase [Deltaproteobacteria bacterium]|nr:protein kinase [Deltaproteobacteria bacterium]